MITPATVRCNSVPVRRSVNDLRTGAATGARTRKPRRCDAAHRAAQPSAAKLQRSTAISMAAATEEELTVLDIRHRSRTAVPNRADGY